MSRTGGRLVTSVACSPPCWSAGLSAPNNNRCLDIDWGTCMKAFLHGCHIVMIWVWLCGLFTHTKGGGGRQRDRDRETQMQRQRKRQTEHREVEKETETETDKGTRNRDNRRRQQDKRCLLLTARSTAKGPNTSRNHKYWKSWSTLHDTRQFVFEDDEGKMKVKERGKLKLEKQHWRKEAIEAIQSDILTYLGSKKERIFGSSGFSAAEDTLNLWVRGIPITGEAGGWGGGGERGRQANRDKQRENQAANARKIEHLWKICKWIAETQSDRTIGLVSR